MAKKIIKKIFQLGGINVSRYDVAREEYRKLYEKYRGYTMIKEELFILNLDLVNRFLNVDGDIVECGVWRGGMAAAMAELAGNESTVHLFDSFEGLPMAKDIDGERALAWQRDTTSKEYYDNCAAEESFAIDAMKIAGHTNYKIHRGWFHDTLPAFGSSPISILRLDGDWYDSVKVCMDKLFPLVSEGGLIIIDDYYAWDGCARAIHDYLSETKSPSRLHQWKDQLGYIVKKK